MSHALRLAGLASLLSLALTSHEAAARPPAYTIHAGFTTALHNVTGKPECVDEACEESLGQVVAEGATDAFDAPVTVVLREYRDRHGLAIKELEELAHKSQKKRGSGTERRVITGQVSGRPAVEIWSTDKPCTPELHARVLVSLPDKVVEIETTAKSEDKEFPTEAFEAMDSILRGVRIRRLSDVSVDPSATRPDDPTLRPVDYLCAVHAPLRYEIALRCAAMTAHRVREVRDPVTFQLDGHRVVAERGEPLAQALIAADKLLLARSPKLHRPRGPSCMRSACDGCLARVDGVPNVMTCLVPAVGGERVETQNVLGTRTIDLLRVTDWFFPDGMDHHRFLAGIPGISPLMQTIARRIAGLGVLPTAPHAKATGERISVDALVIGGGASGIACASALGRRGMSTLLCDDGIALGGSVHALGQRSVDDLLARCSLDGVDVRARTAALGIFDGEALLASHRGATVVRARILVFATGGHDGVATFDGNDVPGVFSARAAARLAAAGVAIGARVVIAGDGPYAAALERPLEGHATITKLAASDLLRIEGATRVGGVVVRDAKGEHRVRADALAVDVPLSPSFELLEQAGVDVRWRDPQGFFPVVSDEGRVSEKVFVTGEVRGTAFDVEALIADGARVAAAVG